MSGNSPIREEEDLQEVAEKDHSLDYLWERLQEEKYDDVIEAAGNVLKEKISLEKQQEALRLTAAAYFHKEQFDLAEQFYKKLTGTSANPDDWFSLATTSTLNRNIETGEKAFEKAIELHQAYGTDKNLPVPQVIYYYMLSLRDIKQYKKAFIQLNRLKDIYCDLQITDSTFLYIRAVPFFETTLEGSRIILENIHKASAQTFINELKKKIDDEGKQYLKNFETTLHYREE